MIQTASPLLLPEPCGCSKAICLRVRPTCSEASAAPREEQADTETGRKLWLRPGKLYLFGRTAAERTSYSKSWAITDLGTNTNFGSNGLAGQLAVSDKTISRKHITIQVENVIEGGGVRYVYPDTPRDYSRAPPFTINH